MDRTHDGSKTLEAEKGNKRRIRITDEMTDYDRFTEMKIIWLKFGNNSAW